MSFISGCNTIFEDLTKQIEHEVRYTYVEKYWSSGYLFWNLSISLCSIILLPITSIRMEADQPNDADIIIAFMI